MTPTAMFLSGLGIGVIVAGLALWFWLIYAMSKSK